MNIYFYTFIIFFYLSGLHLNFVSIFYSFTLIFYLSVPHFDFSLNLCNFYRFIGFNLRSIQYDIYDDMT